MARKKPTTLVFISHSAKDTWIARQVAREVAACGARPFLHEADIDVGGDFEEDIVVKGRVRRIRKG